MALNHRSKKATGIGAVVGVLAISGAAYATMEPSTGDTAATARTLPMPNATSYPSSSPSTSASASKSASPTPTAAAITITAKPSVTSAGSDQVFTVSGKLTGAKPGAKIRLQRQTTPAKGSTPAVWATLAYTTFTGSDNSFSFLVKLDQTGANVMRILHPSDVDGPAQAYSSEFTVTSK
jgi:hypothetical protein